MGGPWRWGVPGVFALGLFVAACALAGAAAAGTQRSASVNPTTGRVQLSGAHSSGGGGSSSSGGGGGSGSAAGASAASAADEAVLPDPGTAFLPAARGVAGSDTTVTVSVPAVRDPRVPTPEGTDVVLLRVSAVHVDFGEGTVVTPTGASPTPFSVDLHHVYEEPGDHVVRTTLVWSALYVPAVGPPRELGPVETTSERRYRVVEVRSALVR